MKLPNADADGHLHSRLMDVPLIEKCTIHMDHIISEDLFFILIGLFNSRHFKISIDLFLVSVSRFIVVTRSSHGDCVRLQKAHPKMTK